MIDIHCHIIPSVDDGVASIEEAVRLVRKEATGGTAAFIATPHVIERTDLEILSRMEPLAEELREALAAEGDSTQIHLGAEMYPSLNVISAVDAGLPVTLARKGKHMLVDLPMGALPSDFGLILYELQVRGITPILAHPERNFTFQSDTDQLRSYLEKGVALQVNAGSLFNKYGPQANAAARFILKRHWAHFVSSDAHRPGTEPILGNARKELQSFLDNQYVVLLTGGSASQIVAGGALPIIPKVEFEPKQETNWLRRLFRRS